jgi:tungstate transport system substrate-binding protein
MTRILLTLFACCAITFAIACGDDDDGDGDASPTASSTEAAEPTKASGEIILASTTSTTDTGLFDVLIPAFEEQYGWEVKLVSVGSGAAIELGSNGDADVVFAHSPAAEREMIEAGNGIERILVMHNDFVIVGPAADPAGLADVADVTAAMTAISTAGTPFISRGDDSGTHAAELRLWEGANIDPAGQPWYEETGQGMGATLQVANQRNAYTLSDRGTFLTQQDTLDLVISFEDDPPLLNYYHVIVVNPEVHPDVNTEGAQAWADFLVSEEGQQLIEEFGVEEFGEPIFFPDAGKDIEATRMMATAARAA